MLQIPYTQHNVWALAMTERSSLSATEQQEPIEFSATGNMGVKTYTQDQTSPVLIIKANKVIVTTSLLNAVAIDDEACEVVDASGMTVGNLLIVTSTIGNRYYHSRILGIAANVLSLDTPFDYAYEAGQQVDATTTNMAVNGSITSPEVFGLRVAEPPPGIEIAVDVTRIIITCKTLGNVDLSKFGDLTALTNGFVMRHKNGFYQNIFNVKDNSEIASIVYDWVVYSANNPNQGQNGFVAKLTFAGQDNLGVTIRVGVLEDIQFLVQDDLTGLQSLEITFEGHIVR